MEVLVIPVTPFVQNATVFFCQRSLQAVVIDPGGDIAKIISELEKHHLELVKILLTHGHIDHVGGVAELLAYKRVAVEGPHQGDRFLIDSLEQQSMMFGFPRVETFTPDRWLNHQDVISFGEINLEVIHCPGHTPGHVVFFHRDSRCAQVGDVIFKGSIGRTDFPRGDHKQLIASIKERLYCLPDDTLFIPGHGPSSTFGDEKKNNPYVNHES